MQILWMVCSCFVIGFKGCVYAIVNGNDAVAGDYPWQLAVEQSGQFICGATLIGNRTALTSAHCVENIDASQLSVKAGMYDRNALPTDYTEVPVSTVIPHQYYAHDPQTVYIHDIAILKLAHDVDTVPGLQIEPINLPNATDTFDGDDCKVSGWGHYETGPGFKLHTILQDAEAKQITNANCNIMLDGVWYYNLQLTEDQMCSFDGTSGACYGDEGGALMCDWLGYGEFYVVGLVSWNVVTMTNGCEVAYPTIYTSVVKYADWILQEVGPTIP